MSDSTLITGYETKRRASAAKPLSVVTVHNRYLMRGGEDEGDADGPGRDEQGEALRQWWIQHNKLPERDLIHLLQPRAHSQFLSHRFSGDLLRLS